MSAVKGKQLETIKCQFCDEFQSKRLTTFEAHLQQEHSMSIQLAWDRINDGPVSCGCGCGEVAPFHGWKAGYGRFIIGHNANVYSSYDDETAAAMMKRRSESLKGKTGWAKGLTKETDERVKLRAEATSKGRQALFQNGSLHVWNKGLTKETDERIHAASENAKNDFATGQREAWTKDKTIDTDSRLLQKTFDLREGYSSGRLKAWHAGMTVAEDPRIAKFWENRDAMKEYSHLRWSDDDITKMLEGNTQTRLERIDSYKNDRTPALVMCCRTCSWQSIVTLSFARVDSCPACAPQGSKAQNELAKWIEDDLGLTIGRNVRGLLQGKKELDIYVPSHKFAIEFNGLYWHSEVAGRDNVFHQSKSDKCAKSGITLFHVYEDEWRDKRHIVESLIKHRLGLSSQRIGARKCSIRRLEVIERRNFFDQNHIDGDTNAKLSIGLIDPSNQIVAAMSLRVPFHASISASSLEVARMATHTDTSVPGGLTRLSRAIMVEAKALGFDQLMSYVDTRLGSSPEAWSDSGWMYAGETTPRFWWTDFRDRFNRFKYRADRSRNMTEAEVATEARVVKIYGCKNIRLTLSSSV